MNPQIAYFSTIMCIFLLLTLVLKLLIEIHYLHIGFVIEIIVDT